MHHKFLLKKAKALLAIHLAPIGFKYINNNTGHFSLCHVQ